MNYYTYIYTDPTRNEIIYVGKGKGQRAYSHLTRKDKHPLVYRLKLMNRQNIKPIISFLCVNVEAELALLCEIEAISKFGRKDLGKGPLLNLTDGGEGAPNVSQDTRDKLSIANIKSNTPKVRKLKSDAMRAHWSLPEFREKRHINLTATTSTVEHRAKQASSTKKSWENPEIRIKRLAAMAAVASTDAYRTTLSTQVKKSWESDTKRRKPCTIDGVTIYKSLKELTTKLGQGKNGARHPDFRYVVAGTVPIVDNVIDNSVGMD